MVKWSNGQTDSMEGVLKWSNGQMDSMEGVLKWSNEETTNPKDLIEYLCAHTYELGNMMVITFSK